MDTNRDDVRVRSESRPESPGSRPGASPAAAEVPGVSGSPASFLGGALEELRHQQEALGAARETLLGLYRRVERESTLRISPEEAERLLDQLRRGAGAGSYLTALMAMAEASGGRSEAAHLPASGADLRIHRAPAGETGGAGREDMRRRRVRFLEEVRHGRRETDPEGLRGYLRRQILGAAYCGHLRLGDRLPSIRELAGVLRCSKHAVVDALAGLVEEGVVGSRKRSGIFLLDPGLAGGEPPHETARWVAEVLAGACEHQVRVPYLPELLRRWALGRTLRCACIEADADSLGTLCEEAGHRFGLDPVAVDAAALSAPGDSGMSDGLVEVVPPADLWVTTPYHAPLLREPARRLGKPLVVASMRPESVEAIERHLRRAPLAVVCVDRRFGERFRTVFGGARPERIHVVVAEDADAVAALSPRARVVMTGPARDRVARSDLRLLVPVSPAFGPGFSRRLTRAIVRLNVDAARTR